MSPTLMGSDRYSVDMPIVVRDWNRSGVVDVRTDGVAYSQTTRHPNVLMVDTRQDPVAQADLAYALTTKTPPHGVLRGAELRRLTPLECERLMGLPDGHTDVERRGRRLSDSARYRLCGNAICVNVLRWIGERIALFESLGEASRG